MIEFYLLFNSCAKSVVTRGKRVVYILYPVPYNMNESRKRKRKNIKLPNGIEQNESLEVVASPAGPIRNIAVSTIDKDILLQRLQIELLDKYQSSGKDSSSNMKSVGDTSVDMQPNLSKLLSEYLVVGTNGCTRALQKAKNKSNHNIDRNDKGVLDSDGKEDIKLLPSLVMLARDSRPPTTMAHIPYLCIQLNVPILLLPGRASLEFGKAFKMKKASVLLFMKCSNEDVSTLSRSEKELINRVNSYVDFAMSKM